MPVAIALGVILGVLGLAIGALRGSTIRRRISQGRVAAAERDAAKILEEAQTKEKEILLEGKEEAIRLRAQVEAEHKERRAEVLKLEQRVAQREESLDRKLEALDRRNQSLDEKEARDEGNRRVRAIEAETREEAEARSRDILATAIQRLATDVVSESTVSVVPIPSDDMKGRIIGREGRNIRALESATGVDLIIDDTPDAGAVASFDPVRP